MSSPNRNSRTGHRKRRISEVLEDINQDIAAIIDSDCPSSPNASFASQSAQSEASFKALEESTYDLSCSEHDQASQLSSASNRGENLLNRLMDAHFLTEENSNTCDVQQRAGLSPESSYCVETSTDGFERSDVVRLKEELLQQEDRSDFCNSIDAIQPKQKIGSPLTSPSKSELEGKLNTTEIFDVDEAQLIDNKCVSIEVEVFKFGKQLVDMESSQLSNAHSFCENDSADYSNKSKEGLEENCMVLDNSIDRPLPENVWQWSTPVKQHPSEATDFALNQPLPLDDVSDVSSISSRESSEIDDASRDSDVRLSDSESIDEASLELSVLAQVNQSEDNEDVEDIFEDAFSQLELYNRTMLHKDSNVSVNEGLLTIMDLYIKNKLSKAGLERTINSYYVFLPENHNMPSSYHQILKYIESLAPPVCANIYYYCKKCLFYLGADVVACEVCKGNPELGRFYCYDVAALIKFFFESRNLASLMDENNNDFSAGLKSVRDGTAYKLINASKGKYDVNLIFGADGVRIRKGSKKELWLALFTIAELPNHLQRSFVTVVGVWYDQKKPDMKTFLRPFAERMASLDQGPDSGVEWTHPTTGQVHKSCVRFLVAVLDAPARAITQNVLHFNGRYGCNICEIKAKRCPAIVGKKRLRVYYYVDDPKLRTEASMLRQAEKAGPDEPCKGVKGPSILSIIPSVDISKCIVPEYLHSVLLGVVKQMLVIWTSIPGEWSLKDRVPEIDVFLKKFRHPSFVHRSERQLKSLKYWKASDFYYFLLFESLPTLKDFLKEKYFQHLVLLVKGIYTLLKSSITQADIDEANLLLKLFVNEFGNLYGDRQLTSNVHQILHLPFCVKLYGPLYCFSAFSFEDLNGLIAKRTHGTNNVDTEIVNNIDICQGIHMLRNAVKGYCSLDGSTNAFCYGELLGAAIKRPPIEDVLLPGSSPKFFSRAKLGYDVFSSEMHKDLNTADFYVMWSEQNDPSPSKYGAIRFFVETTEGKFAVVRLFSVDHTQSFYHKATLKCIEHIVPVKSSENFSVLKLSDIAKSIVKVGKIEQFVYKRPNLYRYVM